MVPFWGTLNIRCRILIGIQKGSIILLTTHIRVQGLESCGTPEVLDPKLSKPRITWPASFGVSQRSKMSLNPKP